MANWLKDQAQGIRDFARGPVVIIVFLACSALAVCGLWLSISDYRTSLEGYRLLPTLKVSEVDFYVVAALPQLAQIAFGYMFVTGRGEINVLGHKVNASALVYLLGHLVDAFSDVYYKSDGLQPGLVAVSIVETEVAFAFGSEIALTIGGGMALELWNDARQHRNRLFGSRRDNPRSARKGNPQNRPKGNNRRDSSKRGSQPPDNRQQAKRGNNNRRNQRRGGVPAPAPNRRDGAADPFPQQMFMGGDE